MLISYSWLKKYVNLPDSISAIDVAAKLNASTVEVEKVEMQGKNLENIVVGKVISCEKHPDADKLKVCAVDVGGEQLQIVCGGSNVAKGMLVALAKVGAKVKWHGEGELMELKPVTIRGVESAGMICAATEIGLAEMFPESGEKSPSGGSPAGREILDLSVILSKAKDPSRSDKRDSSAKPRNDELVGRPLAEVLGLDDAVLEIDNKSLSNRPDLWGHYGIAREVAVLYEKKLSAIGGKGGSAAFQRTVRGMISLNQIKSGKEINIKVEVKDNKLCPRYMAVAMSGITVGPSPRWLQKSLLAVGLRPINNIVDITNYVMMDLCQPMHAFDANRLSDFRLQTSNSKPKSEDRSPKTIIVRTAKDGEEFTALDGQKRKLDSSILMIADSEKALAIAGIMGGLDSGVSEQTKTIILESANFEAASIRRTSVKLDLRTDSSARFEKGLDPNLAALALEKAVELVLECCPAAKAASKIADEAKFSLRQGPITVSMEFLQKKTGIKLSKKEAVKILERLGFGVKIKNDELSVTIPSWRATKDISIPEDLVEEIIRIHGFDKIEAWMPEFSIIPSEVNRLKKLERRVKNILVNSLAYTEVYNYSFISGAQIDKIGDDRAKYLELDNPLSKEKPYLRRCLLLNLLENLEVNQAGKDKIKFFEIGKVFRGEYSGMRAESKKDGLLPGQDTWFTAVYLEKKNEVPFWSARRAVEELSSTALPGLAVSKIGAGGIARHPSRSAGLVMGEKEVGSIYELHPQAAENFGLEGRVGVVKINLSALADLPEAPKKYSTIAEFPSVERDLAISVKKSMAHADILAALSGADPLLQSVKLFDVYEGEGVGADHKSMAYHFVYRSSRRTLVTEEVDKAHEGLIKILKDKFGAEVR